MASEVQVIAGVSACNGAAARRKVPQFGAYWAATTLVLGVVYRLGRWQTEMRAAQAAGGDPFRATSVFPAIIGTVSYLVLVRTGQFFMKGHSALDCKPYMLVYNAFQVLLNAWCVAEFVKEVSGFGEAQHMTFWGSRYDASPAGFKIGFVIWIHYVNKYIELLDTLWMVLRKKNQQVSFLHTYHHVMMMWAWLYVCKIECGGEAWFGAAMNSLIHVVMYSYYLLSQLGVPCPWKKHLTRLQLGQFCVCMVHAAFVYINGKTPRGLPVVQAFVMVNMLVLFSRFYTKSYANAGRGKKVT